MGKRGKEKVFTVLGETKYYLELGEKISIIWIIYTPKVQSVKSVLLELMMFLLLVFL